MKKIMIALTLCTIASASIQAQGLLSKLKNAMMAPAKNGLYEATLNDKGKLISAPAQQSIRAFEWMKSGDEAGKTFSYDSWVLGREWYTLIELPGLTEKIYFYTQNRKPYKVSFQVEDSVFYNFGSKEGFDFSNGKIEMATLLTVLTSDKEFLKELLAWKPTDAPSNPRIGKHALQIQNAMQQYKQGLISAEQNESNALSEKIYNSPLPKPFGDMGQTKMFEAARKVAPKLLKDGFENIDITWLEPLYAYDAQQTRNWTILKDNLGNPVGRGVELWVVCKNNKPSEYVYAKKLYKSKYIAIRFFVKEDGSGNAFTGKYYNTQVATNAIVMVGDDKDAMAYKK
jgi:hypothetical protein